MIQKFVKVQNLVFSVKASMNVVQTFIWVVMIFFRFLQENFNYFESQIYFFAV